MGPDTKGQHEAIEELVAASHYRLGVMIYKVGRRLHDFDVTDAGERLAWVADHCGVRAKD